MPIPGRLWRHAAQKQLCGWKAREDCNWGALAVWGTRARPRFKAVNSLDAAAMGHPLPLDATLELVWGKLSVEAFNSIMELSDK